MIHGNRDRTPSNALSKSISEDIITLYQTKYYDFNFCHFREFLKEKEGIEVSYNFIYKTLMNAEITSPKLRKATKKKLAKQKLKDKKKITDDMNYKEINELVDHEVALEDSHPRMEKPKNFGEIIEEDGSIHLWFGTIKLAFILQMIEQPLLLLVHGLISKKL